MYLVYFLLPHIILFNNSYFIIYYSDKCTVHEYIQSMCPQVYCDELAFHVPTTAAFATSAAASLATATAAAPATSLAAPTTTTLAHPAAGVGSPQHHAQAHDQQ